MTEPDYLPQLGAWLAERTGASPQLALEGRPGSGFSAETLILRAGEERFVLRRQGSEAPIYPGQGPGLSTGVAMQYRLMEHLSRRSAVPVAPLVGYEADPAVAGSPFFVMRHVPGDVPVEDPMFTTSGFYVTATPHQRTQLITEGLRLLVTVAETDVTDLGWLNPGGQPATAERQLQIWADCLHHDLAGRPHPAVERALGWLRAHPPAPGPTVLSWGDSRPGNVIWQDFRPAAATDWEGAALGPRALDLGWWLMCDRWAHEISGVERLPGEPTRPEQAELYADLSGTLPTDLRWFEIFAALRFAGTVVGVMNRWVARGLLPADETIHRDNPAVAVLVSLLDET